MLPARVDEFWVADDSVYLALGAGTVYIGLLEHFAEISALVYAVDDVLEDLILTPCAL
jgi:hypothetical protein